MRYVAKAYSWRNFAMATLHKTLKLFSLPLVLVLSAATVLHAAPRKPRMLNMQPLATYYSSSRGELTLALYSVTQDTDPIQHAAREFHVKLVNKGGNDAIIPYEDLIVVALRDYVEAVDRKYTLFRFNIVIDESSSVSDASLQEVRSVIDTFLRNIPVVYKAQIIRFASTVEVSPSFTSDPDALRAAIHQPRLQGQTALYDAIDQAISELQFSGDDIALNFCIAFTDGYENASVRFSGNPAEKADAFKTKIGRSTQDLMIPLFLGGVGDDVDSDQLASVANETFGLYMKLSNLPELERLFDFVADALMKTYIIRIPITSSFRDLETVYLMHQPSPGRYRTMQDIPIQPGLIH